MRKLYALCQRLAQSDVPVIIEGETGTGKETLAESIHASSARATGPFIVFDCMAVPTTLIESALFGHVAGAFPGASERRHGIFEEADGGTLLFDEIGALESEFQAKLLRVIERGEIRPIGAANTRKIDVRIMASSRRPLDVEVQAGRFRDDLFFRLAVTRVTVPPLRERIGDIPTLASCFWHDLTGKQGPLPQALVNSLTHHSWPGNVRELQNSIARQVALGELADQGTATLNRTSTGPAWLEVGPSAASVHEAGNRAHTKDIATHPSGHPEGRDDIFAQILAMKLPLPMARQRLTLNFERRYIADMLEAHGGDTASAARTAGISKRYFELLCTRIAAAADSDEATLSTTTALADG